MLVERYGLVVVIALGVFTYAASTQTWYWHLASLSALMVLAIGLIALRRKAHFTLVGAVTVFALILLLAWAKFPAR